MSHEKPDLQELFHAAQDIADTGERAAFLEQRCAGDGELRSRLDALLEASGSDTEFLSGPAIASPGKTCDVAPQPQPVSPSADGASGISEGPGTVIGPYKLLQQIGEGGFGVVYMAEQTRPVKRRVALKVIKAGMDTKAVIARFEAERQALAMMEHPNIARVLDAGTTASGRPYFVMELVKGIPITEFCDEAKYDTPRRLEIFVDVCHAVQHAHQKGIIHRDLKPSNVLVTLRDDRPMAKIIDFGIAKATEQKLTEKTLFTAFGQMVGTPVYMSPEQAVMSELDVDTRSDVYSLGVLLYELLTGATPIDPQELRRAGYDEIRRRIREEMPAKPSTRLSTLAPDVKLAVAARRHANPNVLAKECDGDLDWIVLKALEKERTRRYESASAFAQDIGRHLNCEPVSAAAPSRVYRLQKFVARNRGAVVAGVAVALALFVGTVVSTWLALEAREAESKVKIALGEKDEALTEANAQRQRAEHNAAKAEDAERRADARLKQVGKANDVLASVFDNVDPTEVARSDRPLQTVLVEQLDQAVEAIDDDAIGAALDVARIQVKLGKALRVLGDAQRALPVLEKALETIERNPDSERPDVASALLELGLTLDQIGEPERGLPLKKRSLELYEKETGPADDSTLDGKLHVAMSCAILGQLEEALALRTEVYNVRRRDPGPEHPDTLRTESQLARAYWALGSRAKAIEHQEHVREVSEKELGPDDPATWDALYQLSTYYNQMGRPEDALELAEAAWKRTSGAFGEGHRLTLERQTWVATARSRAGQRDRAIALAEETLERIGVAHGEDHPQAVNARGELAKIYGDAGRWDDALLVAKPNYESAKEKLGTEHPLTLTLLTNLCVILGKAESHAEALPYFRESLEIHRQTYGERHPTTVLATYNLATSYRSARRPLDAVPYFEKVLEIRGDLPAEHTPTLEDCVERLADAYLRVGRAEDAIPLREKLLAMERAKEPSDSKAILHRLHLVAGACEAMKDFARSAEIHEEMFVILKKTDGETDQRRLRSCRNCLVRLYSELGRGDKARQVLEDVLAFDAKRLGASDPKVLQRRQQLAQSYEQDGQLEKALDVLVGSLAAQQKVATPESPPDHNTLARISLLRLRLEKWVEAETSARECLTLRKKATPDHWLTYNTHSMLGAALLGQKKFSDAEPFLLAGYKGMWERRRKIPGRARRRVLEALERLVTLYEKRGADGDEEKAARYRNRLVRLAGSLENSWKKS